MPSTLGQLGLTEAMVPSLVRGALDDVVLANNPIQPEPDQLTALVRSLL
jgi:alcohol dehydrogenase class IV